MKQSLLTQLRKPSLNFKEKGSGEMVVTLITLPILIFLIFSFINVSTYFQVRAGVQDVARDGARAVALYGGSTTSAYRNTSGENVATTVYKRLYQNGQCVLSRCSTPPKVDCFVLVNGTKRAVSTTPGQPAVCQVTYTYSSVAPIALELDFVKASFTIDATSITETGYL